MDLKNSDLCPNNTLSSELWAQCKLILIDSGEMMWGDASIQPEKVEDKNET